jgi:hypothetical protein
MALTKKKVSQWLEANGYTVLEVRRNPKFWDNDKKAMVRGPIDALAFAGLYAYFSFPDSEPEEYFKEEFFDIREAARYYEETYYI